MDTRPELQTIGSTVYACETIVEHLKQKLESKKEEPDKVSKVERHVGRFDTTEQLNYWLSEKGGGIRVAALRVPKMEQVGHELIGSVHFVAYVFTTDVFGYQKDIRAEVMVAALAEALLETEWRKGKASSGVSGLRSDNLYSGQIDQKGVAIWSVTWSQDWPLNRPIDLSTLDEFKTLGMTAQIADGAPELKGKIELPQD